MPIRTSKQNRPVHSRRLFFLACLLSVVALFPSCQSTTVLLANFKNDAIGSPPATAQPTGTVSVDAVGGTVTVVASPNSTLPTNNWARIVRTSPQSNPTGLTGQCTQFGTGQYGLLTSLFIPSGSGVVTVQFEASKQSPLPFGHFMHLDFMPEGDVRVDDGPVRFGKFPRNQVFVLSAVLNITATAATVEVTLQGAGGNASGNTTVNIASNVLPLARQFGAVRFHIGFPHQGTVFVDDIIVTRRNP